MMLAKIDGVGDRNAADLLRGTELYVDRDRLPEPDEDEFYYADLIGLDAVSTDGTALGSVRAMAAAAALTGRFTDVRDLG